MDTETVGCDPGSESPVDSARVVVFSVAIPDGVVCPRGFRAAEGFVLPADALGDRHIRAWLESEGHKKVAHNARYDRHALANAGVDLRGVVDTVDIYRLIVPGRERYGLKHLVPDLLGWSMFGDFNDVFSAPVYKTTVKRTKKKVCTAHGEADNANRKYCEVCGEVMVTVEKEVVDVKEQKVRRRVSLQEVCQIPVLESGAFEIRPNEQPLWQTFVNYAGADAVGAAQLYQVRRAPAVVRETPGGHGLTSAGCWEGQRRARVPVGLVSQPQV